ncbi:glycosyltransferase [Halobacterium salinarum]|uniref:glycosyltransferase n=1 Tax=Halobacterium salinarum TaxID=2242 RepID=UPI00255712B6|nr:glycosyltransferase [Halobacterium salinarum]MDL0119336.1 glycosyltransferase [Halobacterium salinarum]
MIAEVVRSATSDEVHIHSFERQSNYNAFINHYNLNSEKVVPVTYPGGNIPGTIYQQTLLNLLSRDSLREYDIIFNSNNCLRFLPGGPKIIHYIHFPIPATLDSDPKYENIIYKIGSIPFLVLFSITTGDPWGTTLTNSDYTRKNTIEAYPSLDPDVLYPPCIDSIKFDGFNGSGVVSVGSFHPNKRQLFQLKVAKKFRGTEFRIIGSKASPGYYRKCKKFINKNDLHNVELYPDATSKKLTRILQKSGIFLHSMKKERFGISTVEGLNQGCVPVVHDSGGQREVVPWKEFRYKNVQECMNILESVLDGSSPTESEIEPHLNKFTTEGFREHLERRLNPQ